jgi:hypothetical protein
VKSNELRTVTRAAVGLIAGLGAFASAAAAAGTGETLVRAAWTAVGSGLAHGRERLLALLAEPAAAEVVVFALAALALAAFSARNLRLARASVRAARRPRNGTQR